MKALIISDVHGNIDALRTVVEAERDADVIYCAGDITEGGLYPSEVISYIKANDIKLVMGNHDRILLEWIADNPSYKIERPDSFFEHDLMTLSDEELEFIRALPVSLDFEMDGVRYLLTHQYERNYNVIWTRCQFDRFWEKHTLKEVDPAVPHCMIFGHSHKQGQMLLGGNRCWLNPGSISCHRDDDTDGANYAIIEDGTVTLKTVYYDRRPMCREAISLGVLSEEKAREMFSIGDELEL